MHENPIPAELLSQYTVDHDLHEESVIIAYVNGQCRGDEVVQYVELVKTEYVSGQRYDVWDVHTEKQRWWVLTNWTNLYRQSNFPSLDYTLSFHIGLMSRLASRQNKGSASREASPFEEVLRRQDEIADIIARAIEAEDFQSAAMRLRECLITLVGAVRRELKIVFDEPVPKSSDVPGWNEVIINHLCPGESKKTLRQYLKSTSEKNLAVGKLVDACS